KVAWSRYRAGDFESALWFMDEEVRKYPAHVLVPAALYWSGRIREASEKPVEKAGAQTYFRRAVEGYPSNFYGLLSLGRIGAPPARAGLNYVAPAAPSDAAP